MSEKNKKSEVISLEEESEVRINDDMIEVEDNSNEVIEVEVQVSQGMQVKSKTHNDRSSVIEIHRPKFKLHSFDTNNKNL